MTSVSATARVSVGAYLLTNFANAFRRDAGSEDNCPAVASPSFWDSSAAIGQIGTWMTCPLSVRTTW